MKEAPNKWFWIGIAAIAFSISAAHAAIGVAEAISGCAP